MQAQKVFASLALNAALALVVVGMVCYRSQGTLGAMITRPSSMTFQPRMHQAHVSGMNARNVRMNAKGAQEKEAVAIEYGTGLAQLAEEEKVVDAVQRDLQVFIDVFNADPNVREFLYDPLAPVEEKRGLVGEVVKKAEMQEYTANFLNLLLDMGRIEQLENCAEVFEEEILKIRGVQQVTVTSAIELDAEAMSGITATMKKLTGVQKLKFKQEIDEDLLAGFVVETEGQRIDMSLKNELEQMRSELLKPADFKAATA